MTLELRSFDAAEYLDGPEEMAALLSDALESGDAGVAADALGVVARARGMTQLAKELSVSRQSLYRALSAEGRPDFGTVMRLMSALGLTLKAQTAGPA